MSEKQLAAVRTAAVRVTTAAKQTQAVETAAAHQNRWFRHRNQPGVTAVHCRSRISSRKRLHNKRKSKTACRSVPRWPCSSSIGRGYHP